MKIVRNTSGYGSFLVPPGHPDHLYEVRDGRGGDHHVCTISYAATHNVSSSERVSARIRQQARLLLADVKPVWSELWCRCIYGYFKNCYLGPDGETDAGKLLVKPADVLPFDLYTPDRHAATAYIRRYFPDHQPRLDLIANPGKGYGRYPCLFCHQIVQYEERADGHVTSRHASPSCPIGGRHLVEIRIDAPVPASQENIC